MDDLNFAQNITMLRRRHGITQETLADFIGVTKASVSKWETGQSLPDIQTLLLLATYYDVTLDELLGYHPGLNRMQIRSLYRGLAKDFAEKPFEEVFLRSQKLVKNYYSCYNFLLQICILWLNHFILAEPEKQGDVLEEILKLCARIYGNSGDSGLCRDAVVLEAVVKLQQGKHDEVITVMEDVCNPYRFARNADSLLFQAYMRAGDIKKADARVQICFYEAVLVMINSVVNYLHLHTGELEKCEAMIGRVDAVLSEGGVGRAGRNAEAQFHYSAATVYCAHGKNAEAIKRLHRFARIVKEMERTDMRLCTDPLLDRLEEWFEENELGTDAVRDSMVVMESVRQALENPVFSGLPQEELAKIRAELN